MAGDSGGLTSGDPLGDEPPRTAERPAPAAPSPYGADRVPPGAFAPRPRDEVVDRFAATPSAGWWQRAVAAVIDAVIVGVAAAILLALSFAPLNLGDGSGVVGALVVALVALVGISIGALLYAPLVMARTDGKTFGKMATGCRVVRADGRRMDFGYAALREVVVKAIGLGVAGAMTGGIAYLVDIFWPFVDRQKRALHDIVVDSRVVRD